MGCLCGNDATLHRTLDAVFRKRRHVIYWSCCKHLCSSCLQKVPYLQEIILGSNQFILLVACYEDLECQLLGDTIMTALMSWAIIIINIIIIINVITITIIMTYGWSLLSPTFDVYNKFRILVPWNWCYINILYPY